MSVKTMLIIGAVLILVMAVAMGYAFLSHSRNQAAEDGILQRGETANARIVSVTDTGSRYNNNPEVIIRLEVQPEKGSPFPAEVRTVVGVVDLQGYQAGSTLKVKYDPLNRAHVVIVGR
jgi:hypothetical protein